MKTFFSVLLLFALLSCEDNSQKSDNEKEQSETKIEIKTDSAEVKIGDEGLSVKAKDGQSDSVNIRINADDGIKFEGKDGKVELKTDEGSKIKIEKKGKNVNIQLKEN